jgi:hypothetical protein
MVVASTFSMWSAYLGNVPSIYYPGQKRISLLDDRKAEIEYEAGSEMSVEFMERINARYMA